jgi:hypothetical protein
MLALTTILAIAAIVTNFQTCAALKETRVSFKSGERPFVSLGRADGTVAEFTKNDAAVILYFQNSGHLPAKRFYLQIIEDHGTIQNMGRFRSPRNPKLIADIGGDSAIPGSSIHKEIIEDDRLSPTSVKAIKQNGGTISGHFEYCDDFGEYTCEQFMLRYKIPPIDSFALLLEADCSLSYAYPIDQAPEIPRGVRWTPINPCEQPDEYAQRQIELGRRLAVPRAIPAIPSTEPLPELVPPSPAN